MKRINHQSYQPTSWNFTINKSGNKDYDDPILNIVQENVKTISKLIEDARADALVEIIYVQNMVNAKTVLHPTPQIGGLILGSIISGLSAIIPAGTAIAAIASIGCKIVAGVVTNICNAKEDQIDRWNEINREVEDLHDLVNIICEKTRIELGSWLEDMKGNWDVEHDCDGLGHVEWKGIVRLSDLAGTNKTPFHDFLPKRTSPEYIWAQVALRKASKYQAAKALLPIKWRIHREMGGFMKWWNVESYKVYNENTWNKWRSDPNFPAKTSHDEDVEGPYFELEDGMRPSDANDFGSQGKYTYHWNESWDANQQGSKWMSHSGKNNLEFSRKNDLIKGTSFLDLIQDVLDGKYYDNSAGWTLSSIADSHSHLFWYKTRRPGENVEVINDKRRYTIMGNDSCIDWKYEMRFIFTWGRARRGLELHHYFLVDENGGYAPKELCDWLFKDDGHGNTTSAEGIETRIDVYFGWLKDM